MKEPGTTPAAGRRPRRVRGYADVATDTRSGILEQVIEQRERLAARLAGIGTVVVVASGKGGVGKSAVTANLAVTLARRGARVGAVDADLNGPSLARMLGVAGARLVDRADGIEPPRGAAGVRVVSSALLLDEDVPLGWKGPASDGFIWHGVTEASMLRELLADVAWRELDYLLIDVPPGTDRIRRLLDLVPRPDSVLLVTIPSPVARSVVARSAALVSEAGLEGVGLVENMSGYARGDEEDPIPLFGGEDAAALGAPHGLEVWARIPFDPELGRRTDAGDPPGDALEGGAGRGVRQLADRVARAEPPGVAESRP